MNRRAIATLATILVWTMPTVTQGKPPPRREAVPKVAPTPVPPEATRTVNALVGRWKFEGALTPPGSMTSVKADFVYTCRKVAGGWAASCEFKAIFPGHPPMEEADLWAFDPEDGRVHLFAVNTAGEVHHHVGDWKGDQTIEFEPLKTTDDHQPVEDSLVVTWEGPRNVGFDAVTTHADHTLTILRAKGKRM